MIDKKLDIDLLDALRDLVPLVQLKKREKHPWRSVTFSKVVFTPQWMFFTFFKLYKWYQIAQRITNRQPLNAAYRHSLMKITHEKKNQERKGEFLIIQKYPGVLGQLPAKKISPQP